MTIMLAIKNDDTQRTAKISVLDKPASGELPTCAQTVLIAPGEWKAVYIHSTRWLEIIELDHAGDPDDFVPAVPDEPPPDPTG